MDQQQPGKWAKLYRDRNASFREAGDSAAELQEVASKPPSRVSRVSRRVVWWVALSQVVLAIVVVCMFGLYKANESFIQSLASIGGGGMGTHTVSGGVSSSVAVTQIACDDGTVAVNLLAAVEAANGPGAPTPPTNHVWMDAYAGDFNVPTVQQQGGYTVIKFADMQGANVTPTAVGNRVVVGGGVSSVQLHAVPLSQDGSASAWTANFSDNGPSLVAADNGYVVVNTESCTLYILEEETGQLVWSRYLGDPLASAPSIGGGLVVSTYPVNGYSSVTLTGSTPQMPNFTPTHVLGAFDLATGQIAWQSWVDGDAVSAPMIADGKVHMTSFGGTRFTFDAATGKPLQAVNDGAMCVPVIAGDQVVYTAQRGGQVKLVASTTDAEPILKTLAGSVAANVDGANMSHGIEAMQARTSGRPAAMGSRVFTVVDGQAVCIDAGTGETVWQATLPGEGDRLPADVTPSLTSNGKMWVATDQGSVLAIDQADGNVLSRYNVGQPTTGQVLVHQGRLIATTENQEVRIIPTDDVLDTGWSTFGGTPSRSGLPASPELAAGL